MAAQTETAAQAADAETAATEQPVERAGLSREHSPVAGDVRPLRGKVLGQPDVPRMVGVDHRAGPLVVAGLNGRDEPIQPLPRHVEPPAGRRDAGREDDQAA